MENDPRDGIEKERDRYRSALELIANAIDHKVPHSFAFCAFTDVKDIARRALADKKP